MNNPNSRSLFTGARRIARTDGRGNPVAYALSRAVECVRLANNSKTDAFAVRMRSRAVFWHHVAQTFTP